MSAPAAWQKLQHLQGDKNNPEAQSVPTQTHYNATNISSLCVRTVICSKIMIGGDFLKIPMFIAQKFNAQ
jgi:hypothetical protein